MFNFTPNDIEFMSTSNGRPVKIILEFLEAKSRLEKHKIYNTVVVFGSARILKPEIAEQNLQQAILSGNVENIETAKNKLEFSQYYTLATQLSYKLANHFKKMPIDNKFYICSGGGPGIMEAANKGAFEANEPTIGFNIDLPFEQHANPYLIPELTFNFNYFFLRKFWFSYLAKAFIVFPGGFGTMDELFEILTLLQTSKMRKKIPIVMINKEFFTSILNLDIMEKYSLISKEDKDLFLLTNNLNEAFDFIVNNLHQYSPTEK